MYLNQGNGRFVHRSTTGSQNNRNAKQGISFGDFDNDSDLDMVNGSIYLNNSNRSNGNPTAPQNIQITQNGNEYTFMWDHSTDPEGGPLEYEFYIYDRYNDTYLTSISSDLNTGRRYVYNRGNAEHLNWVLQNNLPIGYYTFGVQAIDMANGASEFSTHDFTIGTVSNNGKSEINLYSNSDNDLGDNPFNILPEMSDSLLNSTLTSTHSGFFFIDENSNSVFDDGIDTRIVKDQVFNYQKSSTRLFYQTDSNGIETALFNLQAGATIPEFELQILKTEGKPQLMGNANEGGWYLLSNPFTTTIGEMLANVWTQGAINSDAPTGSPTLYTFNQETSAYVPITTDLDTTKLTAGQGLLVYLFEDDDLGDGENDIDGGWPKTLFNYGNPFGENIDITLKNVDHDGFAGTSGSEGFALMGNPYGWSISADSVIATLKREDPFANSYVYLWDPVDKLYYLKLSGEIEPYQSFFVRTISSGITANLNFDYNDAYQQVAAKQIPDQTITFELSNADNDIQSTSQIRFSEFGEAGIDPFDGYYLGSYASGHANLYTKIDDQFLSINNLPLSMAEEAEFPIYLDATVEGEFVLNWTSENIPVGWNISLTDISNGATIELGSETSYSFYNSNKAKKAAILPEFRVASSSVKGKQNTEPKFILTVRPVAVSNEAELGLPREVELEQNYPNPFNPSSVIRFGVPEQAPVQLEVFDILGRKVMTLLHGEIKQPGRYNINFDGRNLSSGMYIYRLVIGDKVLTKKMTLIK